MKPYISPLSIKTAHTLILHLVKLTLDEPGKAFCIAFSGGSTPVLMFDLWANEYTGITPWERLKVFWVDERCVPPENSDSNYGMMKSLLPSIVPIPCENVSRIQGENSPKKGAARYSKLVTREVPVKNGFPVFDVVLLGTSSNGHAPSIFPGQEELLSTDHVCEANFNPNNGRKRIALTGMPILDTRRIIFLITERVKRPVVEDIFYSGDTGSAAYIAYHTDNMELSMDNTMTEEIIRR